MLQGPPAAFGIAFAGVLGPTFASLLVTRLAYGREGLQALWARLRDWRAGRWWWALLIIPAATAVTPVLRGLAGYPQNPSAMLSLIGPGLAVGLTAGLFEEIGWRGFLLPHLLKRYSPLVSTLILGFVVWGGLWHGYADYFGLTSWTLILLLGAVLLTAWTLIITRVFENTRGSLLIAILMHASLSSSALIFGQTYASAGEELLWTSISVGVAWLAAVIAWFALRPSAARGG
jgi:membrane protease YdiL (CAAX protease family)